MMLLAGNAADAEGRAGGLAIAAVASAWILLPTMYAMRYARHWFGAQPDCIDLHQDDPPRFTSGNLSRLHHRHVVCRVDTDLQDPSGSAGSPSARLVVVSVRDSHRSPPPSISSAGLAN